LSVNTEIVQPPGHEEHLAVVQRRRSFESGCTTRSFEAAVCALVKLKAVIDRVKHSHGISIVGREDDIAVARRRGCSKFPGNREAAQATQVHSCAGRADVHQHEAVVVGIEHPNAVRHVRREDHLAVARTGASTELSSTNREAAQTAQVHS